MRYETTKHYMANMFCGAHAKNHKVAMNMRPALVRICKLFCGHWFNQQTLLLNLTLPKKASSLNYNWCASKAPVNVKTLMIQNHSSVVFELVDQDHSWPWAIQVRANIFFKTRLEFSSYLESHWKILNAKYAFLKIDLFVFSLETVKAQVSTIFLLN